MDSFRKGGKVEHVSACFVEAGASNAYTTLCITLIDENVQ